MKLVYILKWFPKTSEAFVLDEVLVHQKAKVALTIFPSLRSPDNVHQNYVGEVCYLTHMWNNESEPESFDFNFHKGLSLPQRVLT